MYNTDKSELLEEYEKLFSAYRKDKINLLEIGIWEGGSLLWAKDYFINGNITGIDLKLPKIEDDRIKMEVCDQNDSARLRDIAEANGGFHIIIDDGSHLRKETKNCFRILWEYVRPGGWYVIEDWDAYKVAPQFKGMTELVQRLLKFECEETRYFKRNKAYAAFKKK